MSKSQIFLGGVGRSGTQAIAVMLHTIPSIFVLDEPRFMGCEGGIPSYLNGEMSFERLKEKVANHFNHFVGDYPSELWKLPDVYTPDKITEAFEKGITSNNHITACYQLIDVFTKLGMEAVGRTQWAIKEPGISSQINWVCEAFPNFKMIHVIREPKDTCCSVITQHWGKEGLEWAVENYKFRMRNAMYVMRVVSECIERRKVYILSLENFIAHPEYAIKQLLSFLDLSLEPDLVQKLIDGVDSKKSTLGRWRTDLTTVECHLVDGICNSIYYDFIRYEKECIKHEQAYMEDKNCG